MLGVELTPDVPVDDLAALAERAEAAGFDAALASNHYNNRDPFLALAAIAAATDELRVGPGVVNPYETHPVKLASQVATLDETSEGRAVFGVGAGDRSTLRNLGFERDRPLRRVLETFRVARRLWAGERVDHDGAFVAEGAALNYADEVGEIPVYVGAQGPHMLRMAAKHADGVLYNAAHPDDVAWARERVSEGLAERPDDRGGFEFAVQAGVSVADDADAAREAARQSVAFVAAGAPEAVLERHAIDAERAAAIGERIERGAFGEAFDLVTERMLDAFCLAGTPAAVAGEVAELLADADGFVAGYPLGPEKGTAIERLGAALDRPRRE